MTKQKGFTLIELLAVIVILAIIALIATPIVLNIIGETKKSATLRSAELYLGAVEQTLVKEMMNGNKIENGSYEITKAGNICLEKENDNTCKKELNIETKGSVPTDGTIQITNGKTNKAEMKIDNEIILQEDEKLTQIKNPIFDKKLTFSYWETFDMDAIDNLDSTKLIEKANYKITITGKDKEPISFEVIKFVINIEGQKASLLGNKAYGAFLCMTGKCLPAFNDFSIQSEDNLKIEYLNQDVYPHVLRAENDTVRLYSMELTDEAATVEYRDSLGNEVTYKDVRVYNDGYNNIHLPISIAYDLVKNGGTFSIKVTQGDKVIEIDADNFTYNTEWDCEGSNYYYYGNNKIGAIGGC